MKEKLNNFFALLKRAGSPIVVSVEIHVHIQDGANVIVADGAVDLATATQQKENQE